MENQPNIYKVTAQIIGEISRDLESSITKSNLAELRNSINRKDFLPIDVMALIFKYLPEKYLGKRGELTPSERSLLMTLQLYAIHQQGKQVAVHQFDLKGNLGSALNPLRQDTNKVNGLDRRFNAMVTATTLNEFFHHLRQIIKISKGQIILNYSRLAQDLYRYQKGYDHEVRIQWSREYYKNFKVTKGEDKNE